MFFGLYPSLLLLREDRSAPGDVDSHGLDHSGGDTADNSVLGSASNGRQVHYGYWNRH
jgi:hypothetical protein